MGVKTGVKIIVKMGVITRIKTGVKTGVKSQTVFFLPYKDPKTNDCVKFCSPGSSSSSPSSSDREKESGEDWMSYEHGSCHSLIVKAPRKKVLTNTHRLTVQCSAVQCSG